MAKQTKKEQKAAAAMVNRFTKVLAKKGITAKRLGKTTIMFQA
jgi:hypothetical protein